MPYEVTDLYFYDDIGYTEQSAYVPAHGVVKKSGSFDTDNFESVKLFDGDGLNLHDSNVPLKVPTSDMFRRFTLRGTYSQLMNSSYCEFVVHWNNTSTFRYTEHSQHFYAWIDSVELKSDTEGNPATVINYHVDLWKTYIDKIDIRYGHILNRPRSDNDPIQPISYNFRMPDEFVPASYNGPGKDLYWVILTFVNESSDHKVTECRTMVAPVSKDAPAQRYKLKLSEDDTEIECPSLSDFINGDYDEQYGISASSVSSVFISPVPPFDIAEIDGTTVTINTSVTDESTTQSTQTGTMVPYHITNLNLWGARVTNNAAIRVIYSDATHTDESITFRSNSSPSASEWVSTHPGARGGTGISSKVANVGVSFLYYTSINDYARACTSTLHPSEGAQFIIKAGYVGSGMSYEIDEDWSATGGSVTETVKDCERATNIIATYNGTNWISDRGTHICFTAESDGNWTYSTSSASTAYSVSIAESSTSGYGYAYTTTGHYFEHRISLPKTVQTDDVYEYLFTDMSATPIGSVPWGVPITELTVRVIVSSSSAYIEYRGNGIDSHATGTCYTVPLPPIDITSNSWSDYVYSGARDLDIEQKRIANQQALVSGISSTLTGGVSNAVMGNIGGPTQNMIEEYNRNLLMSFNSQILNQKGLRRDNMLPAMNSLETAIGLQNMPFNRIGAAGAFGATAAIGIGTAGVEYAINEVFNRKLQKATDIASAKQIDSITMSGSGWDWMWNGQSCGFTRMAPDKYSIDRFKTDIELNGVSVSEPTEDIILTEGPWRISEATIVGKVPVEAKTYISMRLNTGVRIFEDEYYGQ